MRLTQKQEWLVDRYVRAVGNRVDDGADGTREQAVAWVKDRIKRELGAFTKQASGDLQVIGVLQRLGPPSQQAGVLRKTLRRAPLVLSITDRVWLGVCGGIARYLNVDVLQVRLAAVVVGLITGPLAIIGYLGLYFDMYNAARQGEVRERAPQIDGAGVLRMAGGTVTAVLALDLAAQMALMGLGAAGAALGAQANVGLAPWEWLRENLQWTMFAALLTLGPLAILAGLPLAGHWSATVKRVIYAVAAMYAVVLSFGIALNIVGVILQVVARVSIS